MRRALLPFLIVGTAALTNVRAETEAIDLKSLAKKARPAVMLLVVSDANGKEIATGTGFLVSSDGKLITNHHVIENAASAVAKAETGGLFPVEGVLADDPKNDLVLLKLKGKDLSFLPLGNSEKIEVGTRIAVIGSPLGLEGTLSEGIVSAVRVVPGEQHLLQITAAISPGSSGSPLLTAKGEVVGVATSLLREGQALNFAVPVEVIGALLRQSVAAVKMRPVSSVVRRDEGGIDSDLDYLAGQVANVKGDHLKALDYIKQALTRFPNSSKGYSELARTYVMLSFYADAVSAMEQAVKLSPGSPDLWEKLGSALLLKGDYANAIVACQQAIKIWPYYERAWETLSQTYSAQGNQYDADAARQQLEKLKAQFIANHQNAISRDPDSEVAELAWGGLIEAYQQHGDFRDLLRFSKEIIKVRPDNGQAWIHLETACEMLKKKDELIAFCREFLSSHPHSEKPWLSLVPRSDEKGDEVITFCKEYILVNPNNDLAWKWFGMYSNTLKREDELMIFCKEFTKVNPKVGKAWRAIGEVYLGQRNYSAAILALEQSSKLDVDDARTWWLLAHAYSGTGQKKKADEAWSRSEKIDPQSARRSEQISRHFGNEPY
jgi:putative serine protease PepD